MDRFLMPIFEPVYFFIAHALLVVRHDIFIEKKYHIKIYGILTECNFNMEACGKTSNTMTTFVITSKAPNLR